MNDILVKQLAIDFCTDEKSVLDALAVGFVPAWAELYCEAIAKLGEES